MLKLHRDSSFTPPESQNCHVGLAKCDQARLTFCCQCSLVDTRYAKSGGHIRHVLRILKMFDERMQLNSIKLMSDKKPKCPEKPKKILRKNNKGDEEIQKKKKKKKSKEHEKK